MTTMLEMPVMCVTRIRMNMSCTVANATGMLIRLILTSVLATRMAPGNVNCRVDLQPVMLAFVCMAIPVTVHVKCAVVAALHHGLHIPVQITPSVEPSIPQPVLTICVPVLPAYNTDALLAMIGNLGLVHRWFVPPCPEGGTSNVGNTLKTGCYLPTGTTFSDDLGSGIYGKPCYYSES